MEEYEGIENYTRDACDATDATTNTSTHGGQELELWSPADDISYQKGVESEGNQLENAGVLRAGSGNATNRLKSRVLTRAEKSAGAAMRQFAAQERQAEKEKMREWKNKVMEEMTRELHGIRQTYEEEMEAQRQGFQIELEKVGGKLEQLEFRSKTLENEVRALRWSGQLAARSPPPSAVTVSSGSSSDKRAERQTIERRSEERSQQDQPMKTSVTKASTPNQLKQTQPATSSPRKSYAQMAASGSPKVSTENAWTEVTGKKQKANAPRKVEPEKRRVIFRRVVTSPQKSEADLMLVLNEALQRANVPAYVRFIKVGYSQSGAISGLLTEKSNAEELLGEYSTTLIRAAKSVDEGVVGVEKLERWHRLKVHGMPLMRYLGEGKMELLCREIESSTGIKLKTMPRWLISEARLEERLEAGNGKGSAIVITVGSEVEASRLCAKGLRFGGAPKVVEKYWEAGPSSVCMTCSGIGHDRLGGCNERPEQCVICAGAHKTENHACGVTGCGVKKGKICIHVVPRCANCGGNHQATAFRCPARQKAQALAWRNKAKKAQEENPGQTDERLDDRETSAESQGDREVTPKPVDMELDTPTDWAASPGQSSELSSIEDNMPENAQDPW